MQEVEKMSPELAKQMLAEFESTVESVGWKYFWRGYEQLILTARLEIIKRVASVGLRDDRGRPLISTSDQLAGTVRYHQGFYEGIAALRDVKDSVRDALKKNIRPASAEEVITSATR